ncbi:MAG: hypothetical protein HZA50_02095 [Planctomycetes bacterium]|nr:hypothetical protein [Planctomycetota bacterium]
MNHVERFRALMGGRPVDRLPKIEWASWWDKTVERWKTEGLPADMKDSFEISKYFGLDPYKQFWFHPSTPKPPQHGAGIIRNEDDYEKIRPDIYKPLDWAVEIMRPFGQPQARGEVVVWLTLEGYFWYPRRLFGIEGHLYAFYDYPELMHRINQDLTDFHIRWLCEFAKVCPPTWMTLAEDMSYNHGPMLSRQIFDEFLAPYYRQIIPVLKGMGTTVIIDSDGDVTQMVPWLESVGIDGVLPLERQAGVDGCSLKAAHPKFCLIGHFDKMTMPLGEHAMRAEFERLAPMMKAGRFIPSVDHQTPPGVPLENYRIFLRLLDEYATKAKP